MTQDFQRHFNLNTCPREFYFFYWLLELSLAIFLKSFCWFSQSNMNIACRSTQNAARIKRF